MRYSGLRLGCAGGRILTQSDSEGERRCHLIGAFGLQYDIHPIVPRTEKDPGMTEAIPAYRPLVRPATNFGTS